MALSSQNSNLIQECIDTSESILGLRDDLLEIVARWNLNGISTSLTDEDIAGNLAYSHLTKAEVTACITAFQAVITALGDNTSGQASNLIRMKS